MKPKIPKMSSRLFAASMLLSGAAWAAQPVTITNAGFEDPVLADGGFQAGVPGWSAFNSGNINVLNPSSTSDLTAEAPEGQNVGLIQSTAAEDGLSQALADAFQADASYVLTAKVANTKFTGGFPGYRVQLVANNIVLAEDDNSQAVAEDTVVTSTVSYTYNAGLHAALVGQPLEIRLLSKGIASSEELGFDDVQLSVTLLNPAADPGGPYTVPIGGSLALDGSASLPSDGQTITTYEWDLTDDGIWNVDVVTATPTAISDADLKNLYGMDFGNNPIELRVTDSAAKTATAAGTVKLSPPIAGQLGLLDLTANGGINPNTGNPWQAGDKYRIAFHTLNTTDALSNDPDYYNDFATAEAWSVAALQGAYWKAMVTVNLDPTTTEDLSPDSTVKDNTGTADLTGGSGQGGAGEPVYVVNGTTCIARNNADIWDAWSNPFQDLVAGAIVANPSGTGGNNIRIIIGVVGGNNDPHYSPYLDQFGNQSVSADIVHGKDIWTGCNVNGDEINALGVATDVASATRGSSNANNTGRIWQRFTDAKTSLRSLYAISVPLTIVDLSETVAPTLLSFVDDRSGADAILGVDSVVYTVTFSETINAATLTIDDFENAGSATVTIDSIRGTLDPAAFEVTVTPTSAGTIQLQTKAGVNIEDPVGNALDTTSPITDDTTITVVSDVTPPTLVSIEDDVTGGPVVAFNGITYTVTFDEGMDASSVDIADFGNGGSAPLTINSVSPTGNPAVFIVEVTPTGAGDLTLVVLAGAAITDLSGNSLDTTAALPDDTTITISADPLPALVSITDNQAGGPVFATQSFAYLVTFDQVIDPATVDISDFENSTAPALTVNQVAATSDPSVYAVHITPGGAGTITLQIAAGAVITNTNGTALDTTSPLADDTTITVNAGSGPARGTITVNGTASWSANSGTLTGTLEASPSDKLVVVVTGEHGNPGDLTGDSTAVTYNGVPLIKIIDRNPIGGTPIDQTFNDIWYLDLDGVAAVSGSIVASVLTRGSVTAFALSGTAPGAGQTAISPQASKSVILSTGFANSIVIASHGMGGDGNTANVAAVDAELPLIEASATSQASGSPSPWDGHVTAYALIPSAGTASYSFTGGNLVGSHTIAAEFLAAEDTGGGNPFGSWASGFAGLSDPNPSVDFDNGGLATGVEWVVGGDPTLGSDDAGKAPTLNNSDPNNFVFTYLRRDTAQADPKTAIVVEYGSNLSGWTSATHGVNGVTIDDTNVPQAGFRTVVVSIPKSLALGGKLFARLNVVITP